MVPSDGPTVYLPVTRTVVTLCNVFLVLVTDPLDSPFRHTVSAASSTFTDRAHHAHGPHGLPRTAGAARVNMVAVRDGTGLNTHSTAPEQGALAGSASMDRDAAMQTLLAEAFAEFDLDDADIDVTMEAKPTKEAKLLHTLLHSSTHPAAGRVGASTDAAGGSTALDGGGAAVDGCRTAPRGGRLGGGSPRGALNGSTPRDGAPNGYALGSDTLDGGALGNGMLGGALDGCAPDRDVLNGCALGGSVLSASSLCGSAAPDGGVIGDDGVSALSDCPSAELGGASARGVAGGGSRGNAGDGSRGVAGGGSRGNAGDGSRGVAGGGSRGNAGDGSWGVAGGGSRGNAGDGSRGVAGGGAYTIFAVILAACVTRGLAASAVGVSGTRLATRPRDGVSLSAYAWRPPGFTGAGSNGERLAGLLRAPTRTVTRGPGAPVPRPSS